MSLGIEYCKEIYKVKGEMYIIIKDIKSKASMKYIIWQDLHLRLYLYLSVSDVYTDILNLLLLVEICSQIVAEKYENLP